MTTPGDENKSKHWQYPASSEGWTGDGKKCVTCGARPVTVCRLCGHESCLEHASHACQRCHRFIEVVRHATGVSAIETRGIRPCGGRLIDGKCEFCDVALIEEGR